MVEKTITRKYSFGAHEIRDALLLYMKDRDFPLPSKVQNGEHFTMNPNGATIEWTEKSEQ
jgi:hypothetical protein